MPETKLLFLHVLTGLHPGSGTSTGAVDLPVQRETHTQWPVIPGSTLKGVLRDGVRRHVANGGDLALADQGDIVGRIFGPKTIDYAGALAPTDAVLVAFPVRSLRGVFAWITCPLALERLQKALVLAGKHDSLTLPDVFDPNRALVPDRSPLVVGKSETSRGTVVLEDLDFAIAGDCSELAGQLAGLALSDGPTQKRMKEQLAVLSDTEFTHFVRYSTEVTARIGLEIATKTVKEGALFYEEFVPTESVFAACLTMSASRKDGDDTEARALMQQFCDAMPKPFVLQIGANETIGKGFCAARID